MIILNCKKLGGNTLDSLTEMLNAEQAAHIAQLQLRNQILQIGTLIWVALLLSWLIYSFIKFYRASRPSLMSNKSAIHFQCTKCNTNFLILTDFLIKHPFMPKKTFTVSTPMIGFTSSIQRKLYCPCCNQKI